MLKLLKLLQDGRFHSGEALGTALGVSRSAIWKQLQQLEAELNLPIFKVRGHGYRLPAPLILLDKDRIASGKGPAWSFFLHESLDSTNAEALRLLGRGEVAPFVVLAERQTGGRGRRGRSWFSPFAENLYYSLVIRIDGGAHQVEGLSLVVGLAVVRALSALGVGGVGLKWPNDILVNEKKIAGILLELMGDPADICHVVIGVGINANMNSELQAIDQPWTSLCLELGELIDRNLLIIELNDQLETYLSSHFEKGFAGLRAEWEKNHLWQGRQVDLIAGAQRIGGTVLGINDRGALRLLVDGAEREFSGGELSLRLRNDS